MIQGLIDLWLEASEAIAKDFGVLASVLPEGTGNVGFYLGSMLAFSVIERSNYFLIEHIEWNADHFDSKKLIDQTSSSLEISTQRFIPTMIDELARNSRSIISSGIFT